MTNIKSWLTEGDNIYFFRMFRFMRPYSFRFAISQIVYSGQSFMLPFLVTMFAGGVTDAIVAADAGAIADAGRQLVSFTLVFLFILLIAVYVNALSVEKAAMDMKRALFAKFMRTGLEYAEHSGRSIAAINTDAYTALEIFRRPLMTFFGKILTIIGATAVVFTIDWRLGLFALIIGALSFFMQNRFTRPLSRIGKLQLKTNSDAVSAISDAFAGRMAIRAYNLQQRMHDSFSRHNDVLKLLDIKRGLIQVGQNTFKTVEGWLTLIMVFGFGGWLAANGQLEFGQIAIVFGMGTSLTSAIGSLGAAYADLQPPIAGAKRVFEILDADGDCESQAKNFHSIKPAGYALEIDGLNFAYTGSDHNVLSDLKLQIGENQMFVFLGKSGSGKSTLLRAITGIYERDDLRMSLGGVSFNDIDIKDWRKNFAYVDQNCTLFDMSIKENIALGYDGDLDDADIIEAAKKAYAHDFIMQLGGGYDAPCGEKGDELSGGQKQRIAIARALVRRAPILVFDEPTSALDKESEECIMATIESLRKNHTILIATHKPDSVTNADCKVYLKDGRVKS